MEQQSLDQELYAAYTCHFLQRYRQASCLRKIAPDPELMRPFPRSGTISSTKQFQVYERDNWICCLCRLPVEWDTTMARSPSVDHVIPRSRGGSNEIENLRLAHHQCNTLKGSRPHFVTLFTRDHWQCRRCQHAISLEEETRDWLTRPVVEHSYPLDSGEVWASSLYAWSIHERCRVMWTLDGTYLGEARKMGETEQLCQEIGQDHAGLDSVVAVEHASEQSSGGTKRRILSRGHRS
jgi:HNH endonuclease